MKSKYEVTRSEEGGCYICSDTDEQLYLVRDTKTGHMTALCSCCLLTRLDDYLIDNTREWPPACRLPAKAEQTEAPVESD